MTAELRHGYLRAQLAGDRAAALAVVTAALAAGLTVPQVQLEIIQWSQYEIGKLWERNAISIAAEHQATAISQLALANLYERLPRRPRLGKRVVLACVEGEMHDMGSRIAADFLEMAGFDVRLLGANVPAVSLGERVEKERPDLVALSATMTFHLPAIERAIAAVRGTTVARIPVLIGGRAFAWARGAAAKLDAQGFGSDADTLVAEALRLTHPGD
jgi:methanogenic corrinoid protein MtbC1